MKTWEFNTHFRFYFFNDPDQTEIETVVNWTKPGCFVLNNSPVSPTVTLRPEKHDICV